MIGLDSIHSVIKPNLDSAAVPTGDWPPSRRRGALARREGG
jgi:hypothetical protein